MRVPLLLIVVAGLCAGCKKDPVAPAPSASAPVPVASSVTSASSAPAPASASAAPQVSADRAVAWKGTYTAEPVKLKTPDKVKDLTWQNDDKTKLVGDGTLELQLDQATGHVRGEGDGALGKLLLSGMYDGRELRATLLPHDPTAADAMTGTLMGELKNDVIQGTIRASDSKGVSVREASFQLHPAR